MEYQNENFNGKYDFRSHSHNGWHMQANLHEYSELLYCKTGEGLVTVNGEAIPLGEHEMVWIPPNYIHQYDFDQAEVICAVFSNDFIPLFFEQLGGRYFCVSAVNVAHLSALLEALPTLERQDALRVSGYLHLIGAAVLEQAEFDTGRKTDGILYQKVISYLKDNCTEDITLSRLAKEFGYHEKYLSHALHALTGIHFRQLLNFYRINLAKRLLTETADTVGVIAMECGFGALNTFNREFKRAVGMTPREYRRLV